MALSKIQAESMNLADTYAFTGDVTAGNDVERVTASGSVTSGTSHEIEINDCFSSDYSAYRIYLYDLLTNQTNSQGVEFKLQLKNSSGLITSGYYNRSYRSYTGHTAHEVDRAENAANFTLGFNQLIMGDTNSGGAFYMDVLTADDYHTNVHFNIWGEHPSNNIAIPSIGIGMLANTTQKTGFKFFMSSSSYDFTNYKYRVIGLR